MFIYALHLAFNKVLDGVLAITSSWQEITINSNLSTAMTNINSTVSLINTFVNAETLITIIALVIALETAIIVFRIITWLIPGLG